MQNIWQELKKYSGFRREGEHNEYKRKRRNTEGVEAMEDHKLCGMEEGR